MNEEELKYVEWLRGEDDLKRYYRKIKRFDILREMKGGNK